MRAEVVSQLLTINTQFYNQRAKPFAQSRLKPQPGFYRLLEELPKPCPTFLDVGCGDGRLGRFLQENKAITHYVGVDFSEGLLAIAAEVGQGHFYQRDMSQPHSLAGFGRFDAIACLAALHHIPNRQNRVQFLREIKAHLKKNGRVLLSTWQFMHSDRQRRKIADWQQVGLQPSDVEPHDYLLSWQRGGFSWRYVCMIDAHEMVQLAQETGLHIETQFHADGKEGNLSLYTILHKT